MASPSNPQIQPEPSLFPETRWTVVLHAQGSSDTHIQRALGELCQTYWYPLYVYARKSGLSPHDAEDRVQAFFQSVLANQSLATVDRSRGKLRAFLQAAMRNFLNDRWRHDLAQKRGGTAVHLSIDQEWAESRLAGEIDSNDAFDRSWAFSVLRSVFARLENHFDRQDRRDLYEAIKGCLYGEGRTKPGREIAKRLAISEEGVRSAIFKLRRRFRDYVREEIRDTCASEDDAREEIAYLCRILTQHAPP